MHDHAEELKKLSSSGASAAVTVRNSVDGSTVVEPGFGTAVSWVDQGSDPSARVGRQIDDHAFAERLMRKQTYTLEELEEQGVTSEQGSYIPVGRTGLKWKRLNHQEGKRLETHGMRVRHVDLEDRLARTEEGLLELSVAEFKLYDLERLLGEVPLGKDCYVAAGGSVWKPLFGERIFSPAPPPLQRKSRPFQISLESMVDYILGAGMNPTEERKPRPASASRAPPR